MSRIHYHKFKFPSILILMLLLISFPGSTHAQTMAIKLEQQMLAYEYDLVQAYNEFQKLYYESKSSKAELAAFEALITIYVQSILDIYDTLVLTNNLNLETARSIASRAFIFRSLLYLESASTLRENYEKAAYDYYQALELFKTSNTIPSIFKNLPYTLEVGTKKYMRLIELVDEKGKELQSFGRVELTFRNFGQASNLNVEDIDFIKAENPGHKEKYTYHIAEVKLNEAMKEALTKRISVTVSVALPEGTYYLQGSSDNSSNSVDLTSIYVRANSQQKYTIEPMDGWMISYEVPSNTRPDFNRLMEVVFADPGSKNDPRPVRPRRVLSQDAVNVIVVDCMHPGLFDLLSNLTIPPDIRKKFVLTASREITNAVQTSEFHNRWDLWDVSWDIAERIRYSINTLDDFLPEVAVLVHCVLSRLVEKV